MKSQFLQILASTPRVTRRDLLLTFLAALLWLGLLQLRSVILRPFCAQNPATCTKESVFFQLDRSSLGWESGDADGLSYAGQNVSGILAMGVPVAWSAGLAIAGRVTPAVAVASTLADLTIFAQTAALNGVGVELSHWANRPRPFVYQDPTHRGQDPAHYTSFYSGHTSFAAAASISMVLALLGRGAPLVVTGLALFLSQFLVILTGTCRVLAGRHFPTDVLAAAIAGTLVAVAVAYFHRDRAFRSSRRSRAGLEIASPSR